MATQQSLLDSIPDEAIDRVFSSYEEKTYRETSIDLSLVPTAQEARELFEKKSEEIREIGKRNTGYVFSQYGDLSLALLLKAIFLQPSPKVDSPKKYDYDRAVISASGFLTECKGPQLGTTHLNFLLKLIALSLYQERSEVCFKLKDLALWLNAKNQSLEALKQLFDELHGGLISTDIKTPDRTGTNFYSIVPRVVVTKTQKLEDRIYFVELGDHLYELGAVDDFIFRKLKRTLC